MGADFLMELDGVQGEYVGDRNSNSSSEIKPPLNGENKEITGQTEGEKDVDLEGFDRVFNDAKKFMDEAERKVKYF